MNICKCLASHWSNASWLKMNEASSVMPPSLLPLSLLLLQNIPQLLPLLLHSLRTTHSRTWQLLPPLSLVVHFSTFLKKALWVLRNGQQCYILEWLHSVMVDVRIPTWVFWLFTWKWFSEPWDGAEGDHRKKRGHCGLGFPHSGMSQSPHEVSDQTYGRGAEQ